MSAAAILNAIDVNARAKGETTQGEDEEDVRAYLISLSLQTCAGFYNDWRQTVGMSDEAAAYEAAG